MSQKKETLRKVKRWPVVCFFKLLDIAALKCADHMDNERSHLGRKEEIQTAFLEAVGKIACHSMDHCQGQQITVMTGAPHNSGSGI